MEQGACIGKPKVQRIPANGRKGQGVSVGRLKGEGAPVGEQRDHGVAVSELKARECGSAEGLRSSVMEIKEYGAIIYR